MSDSLSRLGDLVRALREEAGLTQAQLAKRSGTALSAIARLERGKVAPAIPTLASIAEALGLELVLRLEKPAPPLDEMQAKIRVLVAETHLLTTEALAVALAQVPGMEVLAGGGKAGRATTGLEAAAAAEQLKPDVVVMDYWMPVTGAAAAIRTILGSAPGTKVLVLSWSPAPDHIREVMEAGAAGFLPKTISLDRLAEGIRRAHAGERPVFGRQLGDLQEELRARDATSRGLRQRLATLTPREVDVLRLVSHGRPMKEVAAALSVTPATLRLHLQNAMSKIGAGSKLEAIAAAREHGLFGP